MKIFRIIIISFILLSAFLLGAEAREYIAVRTSNPPVIDGRLDDACWETVASSGDFRMHQPYDDRPATFDTEFSILYDNDNLYVAVRAFDPEPDKIYRQITRRDNINSEFIGICIDSYHDRNTAYCFLVTASGVKGDVFISKDGENNDDSWDAIWWAKSQIDSAGWTAEFRIPLSQLRFVNADEQIWGFDVMRSVYRGNEESFWMEHRQDASGFIHQFGVLRGLYDIKARKVLDIVPYTVGHVDTYEAETGNPYRDGSDLGFNGGVDGKIGLSNNFTMDFTINPDFGQVEADPATVNLSAFETFLSERRPFFIEGSNITMYTLDVSTGHNSEEKLFHSRRIGRAPHYWPVLGSNDYADIPSATNILAAAKITGRTESGLNIGIVEAVTQKEYAKVMRDGVETQETVEPLSNYTVAAARQDLNEGSTQVGAVVTSVYRKLDEEHLTFLHKQAYSGGLDLRHYGKDRAWQLDLRTYGSYVQGSKEAISNTQLSSSHLYQRPDANWVEYDSTRTHLSGYGGSTQIGKFGGAFQAAFKVKWKSPGLELNDLGFMYGTDNISQNIWLNYRKTEPFGIFRNIYATMLQWNSWNFGGLHQNSGINLQMETRFKNLMGLNLGIEVNSKFLSSTALRGGPRLLRPGATYEWVWFGTDYTKDLHGWVFFLGGKNKDNLYNSQRLESEVSWKISQNVNMSFYADWSRTHDVFQYVTKVDYYGDPRYILSQIHQESASLQLGINVNITPNMSIEYRGRPYFSSANFSEFKRITNADDPIHENRFDLFTNNIKLNNGIYYCDEDRNTSLDYSFGNPNFVYSSFKSNLVFRWEYFPGSTLFLVWSQNNDINLDGNRIILSENINSLREEIPYNVFLLKLSYRLGR